MTVSKEVLALREKCKMDLKFLCKTVLGMKDWQDGLHDELALFLDSQGNRKVILIPRYHLKSSIVTVGWVIQQLLRDHNATILITNATLARAKELLGQIQGYLTDKSLLPDIFGPFQNNRYGWTSEKMTIAQRTSGTIKEPTISIASPTTNVTGGHYTLVLNDDLVERGNVSTPDQIQKIKNFYKDVVNLSPKSPIITVGTRWSMGDLYGELIQNKYHKTFIRSAVDGEGKVVFPNMVCRDRTDILWENKICLEAQFEILGPYEYSCQFLNNPVSEDSIEFKTSWVQKYAVDGPEALRLVGIRGILSIDPAVRLKETNDYTGLVVTKVTPERRIYILEAQQRKLSPKELIDEVFKLVEMYNIGKVLIETTAAQILFLDLFRDEMIKRNKFFAVEEVKSSTKETKVVRIRALIPYYANGMIFHRPGLTILEEQLIQFPRNTNDDVIDALSHQVSYWKATPGKTIVKETAPYGSLNWWKKQRGESSGERFKSLFKDFITRG